MDELERKIAHLQVVQDNYVGQILGIASVLFYKIPEAKFKMAEGDTEIYQKTLLLIREDLERINKIVGEAISVAKDWQTE